VYYLDSEEKCYRGPVSGSSSRARKLEFGATSSANSARERRAKGLSHLPRPQQPVTLPADLPKLVTCPRCNSSVVAREVMTIQLCTPSPEPRVVLEGVMCNLCDQPIFLTGVGLTTGTRG
jgi:hypothetical protein